eukprot:2727068-Pyramimonas_sp.AAC.1
MGRAEKVFIIPKVASKPETLKPALPAAGGPGKRRLPGAADSEAPRRSRPAELTDFGRGKMENPKRRKDPKALKTLKTLKP